VDYLFCRRLPVVAGILQLVFDFIACAQTSLKIIDLKGASGLNGRITMMSATEVPPSIKTNFAKTSLRFSNGTPNTKYPTLSGSKTSDSSQNYSLENWPTEPSDIDLQTS
jgi:hypothetical protein